MHTIKHVAFLFAVAFPFAALAITSVTVVQKGRAFAVQMLTVMPGQVVRFENEDDFPHQIQVKGPGITFDSDLQDTGETVDVTFPSAGLFTVQCGIHPRMRMTIRVEAKL